ncbi:undecaprenyl-diphosphate phosphatase [Oceanivirga salmonicida]|uniref:undecaprenyl-diphosphate phosphatase n=1 Tax=Oceanivirga salmonicida TaxID=1769291 RepID=UPI00082CB662|nr:undecaprenyl-diphosphate phosphatase [Oceanivirga salmonicida]
MIEILKVVFLSFIEGLTEFIPVSSTGHMIIVEHFINLSNNKVFVSSFEIIIQLGAILSVFVYFYKEIFKLEKETFIKIIVAVIPAGILGVLFSDYIEEKLFNIYVVSFMLIFYGVILIILEKISKKSKVNSLNNVSFKQAIYVGIFQCLAFVPGTSRSAATIIGAMLLGLNRVVATEFSFFLAIPTMLGATTLKLIKMPVLSFNEYMLILLGFVLSFIFAYGFIKFFMEYIKKHDFKMFGYYRITLGIILLIIVKLV